jgi:hypothetical protein
MAWSVGWITTVGFPESDPTAVGMQDDLEVSFVDDDMVVVPAQDD